jgi:hypothetical protein
MRMTIEEKAIKTLNEIIDEGWLISDMEKIDACEFAIDRIRRYQKICKILDKSDNGEQCMYDTIQEIEEIRDGNDD